MVKQFMFHQLQLSITEKRLFMPTSGFSKAAAATT